MLLSNDCSSESPRLDRSSPGIPPAEPPEPPLELLLPGAGGLFK